MLATRSENQPAPLVPELAQPIQPLKSEHEAEVLDFSPLSCLRS